MNILTKFAKILLKLSILFLVLLGTIGPVFPGSFYLPTVAFGELIFYITALLFSIGLVKYIEYKFFKETTQQKGSEAKKLLFYTGTTMMCLTVVAWLVSIALYTTMRFFEYPSIF